MTWKDVEFTGSDSAERVRRLQQFCTDADARPSANDADAVDALLIVGGVDSFHSRLSQALLKYLFLGGSGQELLGEQVLSQAHDRLEDVVVLLTRRRVSIFYSSESDAAIQILPMIAQWRHVTEYTIHDAMDPDEQETRKVQAFKQMVASVKRVGIPYGVDARGNDLQDPMVPEKWPLVQAFGLEDGANGSGFFTMHHTVVNVSARLCEELARLDDFSAKRVAIQVPPMLTHHFDQFLLKLDHAESPFVRNSKSESEMGEDLVSLYEFGTTQHEARGLTITDHRGSRVLFGTRTSQVATAKSSPTVFLHNAGTNKRAPATHMLVQSEDPFSGVRFTRTYFLATGKTASRIVDEDALVHQEDVELGKKEAEDKADEDGSSVDTRVLIELYVLLLREFRRGLRAFVQAATRDPHATLTQCCAVSKAKAVEEIRKQSKSTRMWRTAKTPMHDFLETNLVVDAESLDACGRATRFPGHKWTLVYVSCTLQHVPCQQSASESLGSLTVGDTVLFLNSAPGAFLNATGSFPYFRSWIQAGRESDSVRAQLAVLQSGFMLQSPALRLGQPMAPLDASLDEPTPRLSSDPASSITLANATPSVTSVGLSRAVLLLECDELPRLDGSLQLFTGGFCFKTPHVIPLVVSFAAHVTSFCVQATPYEELVLLQLELTVDADDETVVSRALPFATTSRSVAFPLLAGTRFQEEIVHALSVWKPTAERLGIPFYRPHDLVTQFDGTTPRDDDRTSSRGELSTRMATSCELMVQKPSSPNSYSDSTGATVDQLFPRWFIPKDANPTTTLPRPRSDRIKIVVPITVVLGLPGSSAKSIARTICDVSSATTEWARIDIDCREVPGGAGVDQDEYSRSQIQQRVGAALRRIMDAPTCEWPVRVLLCVVGYIDAVAVAATAKQGGDAWCLTTRMASIIACVSATNVYLPDAPEGAQRPLPRLFDQLARGFATHVVVTHASDVQSQALGRLRYHIDQANPFADIHVLSSDVFEGSLTPLLCVDRFESGYYKSYRDVQFPEWATAFAQLYRGQMDPAVAPQSLRFELASGMDKARFLQFVGKTLTPYAAMTKSMDKIHPMDPQLMARPQSTGKGDAGGIRLAQTLAAEKVLAQQRQQLQDERDMYGDCWSVEARVMFAGDEDTVYEYVSTGTYARMRTVDDTATSRNLEIQITGRDLQASRIQELLLKCYPTLDGTARSIRTKGTLTIDEKREIQKRHIMDDLPEGFYYDGVTYIDQFGGRHEFHPRMNEFIDEYLHSVNEKTKLHNVHVEEARKSQPTFVRQL